MIKTRTASVAVALGLVLLSGPFEVAKSDAAGFWRTGRQLRCFPV
jgi:hypothetical protein